MAFNPPTLVPQPSLPDIFLQAVADAAVIYGSPIRGEFGSMEELEQKLQRVNQAQGIPGYLQLDPFPLIFMLTDVPEKRGGPSLYLSEIRVPLIAIMCLTSRTYSSAERYTNSFTPVLYPIYDAFLLSLSQQPNVVNALRDIVHTKTDRLFWGTKPIGTVVSQYVDGISMEGVELTISENGVC